MLAGLPKPLPIRILREPDWQVARGLVRIDRRVELDMLLRRLRYAMNEGALDESWVGSSVQVTFNSDGQPWSYRTVIRSLFPGGFKAEPPIELRQGALGTPGHNWVAPSDGQTTPYGYDWLPIRSVQDMPTKLVFMSMLGGDLHLRSGRSTEINHPSRVRESLERLCAQSALLLTVAGDHGACEALLEMPQTGLPLLTIRCGHRGLLPLKKGRAIFLTGILGAEQFTLKSVVLKVEHDRVIVRRPKEIHRLQRRRTVLYAMRGAQLAVSLWDGMNMRGVEGIVDLSEEGIGVLMSPETAPRVGDVYKVVMAMGKKQTLGITGICVSSGESGWHFRRSGFEFVDLDERSRRVIKHWLDKFGRALNR